MTREPALKTTDTDRDRLAATIERGIDEDAPPVAVQLAGGATVRVTRLTRSFYAVMPARGNGIGVFVHPTTGRLHTAADRNRLETVIRRAYRLARERPAQPPL